MSVIDLPPPLINCFSIKDNESVSQGIRLRPDLNPDEESHYLPLSGGERIYRARHRGCEYVPLLHGAILATAAILRPNVGTPGYVLGTPKGNKIDYALVRVEFSSDGSHERLRMNGRTFSLFEGIVGGEALCSGHRLNLVKLAIGENLSRLFPNGKLRHFCYTGEKLEEHQLSPLDVLGERMSSGFNRFLIADEETDWLKRDNAIMGMMYEMMDYFEALAVLAPKGSVSGCRQTLLKEFFLELPRQVFGKFFTQLQEKVEEFEPELLPLLLGAPSAKVVALKPGGKNFRAANNLAQ